MHLTPGTTIYSIGNMEDFPIDLTDFRKRFSTEEACIDYLMSLRWPDGIVCPACGSSQIRRTTRGLFECKNCLRQTSVTAGTLGAFLWFRSRIADSWGKESRWKFRSWINHGIAWCTILDKTQHIGGVGVKCISPFSFFKIKSGSWMNERVQRNYPQTWYQSMMTISYVFSDIDEIIDSNYTDDLVKLTKKLGIIIYVHLHHLR